MITLQQGNPALWAQVVAAGQYASARSLPPVWDPGDRLTDGSGITWQNTAPGDPGLWYRVIDLDAATSSTGSVAASGVTVTTAGLVVVAHTNVQAALADLDALATAHATRHAPGGADSLSPYFAGRQLAYVESLATFTFDGTGGQTANVFTDLTGMALPSFNVTDKPVELLIDAYYFLKNGASKFTGALLVDFDLVCTAAPNAGDVGVEVLRGSVKHDQVTASNTAVNVSFKIDRCGARRTFALGTAGVAGLASGLIAPGNGYQFKVQMRSTTVTNISVLNAIPATGTPAAIARAIEV